MNGWTRRDLLAAGSLAPALRGAVLGSAALGGATGRAGATEQGRLLVAGPAGGHLAELAGALQPALLRGLAGGGTLETRTAGGEDGVTGANQFEARFDGEADGTAMLLLPGATATAWLAGDPRVQYDAARWLPLLCGVKPGALVSRRTMQTARGGSPWRVAMPEALGAASACLLALDVLGVPADPVPEADPASALAAERVDAAFLGATEAALPPGLTPVFTLGVPAPAGDGQVDPAPPPASSPAPRLNDLLAGAAAVLPALAPALHAVAAACVLDYALVMPALTPAPSVALWREAVARMGEAEELRAARPAGVRSLAATECGSLRTAIAITPEPLLAYRHWLAARLGYRPA